MNGSLLLDLLKQQSIQTVPVEIKGNIRESIVVTETTTNKEFKFIMPGPVVSEEEIRRIKATVMELKDVSFLIFSGSLPPGITESFLAEIASIAKAKKIKFIVDTSGPALRAAMKEGVYMIKPNMTELCFLADTKYLELSEIEGAVDRIINEGLCEVLVVSMGPAGGLLATKSFKKRFAAPTVKKISTVGAGDSMIAGIVWMLQQNKSLEDAMRLGLACGTAATINKGSQVFKKEDAMKFFEWMKQ
jgi:6-phosphofructokinase 2